MCLSKTWRIRATKKIDKYMITVHKRSSHIYIYLNKQNLDKFINDIKEKKSEEYIEATDTFDMDKHYLILKNTIESSEDYQLTENYSSDNTFDTEEQANLASKELGSEWYDVKVVYERK